MDVKGSTYLEMVAIKESLDKAVVRRGRGDCARENFARQTESLCNCGSTLRHRSCGVEWSVVLYRDGAVFENSGAHNHSKYTHLLELTITKNKKLQLQGLVSKQPIALRTLEDEDNVNIDSIDSDEEDQDGHKSEEKDGMDSEDEKILDPMADANEDKEENENDGEEQDEDKEEDDDYGKKKVGTDPGLEYGEKLPAQVIPEMPDFEPPSEISQALAKTNLLNLTVIWIMLHGPQRARLKIVYSAQFKTHTNTCVNWRGILVYLQSVVHVATAGKRHSAYWSSQGCFVEVALHNRDPLPKFPLTRDNGRSPISINNPAGTEKAPNKRRPRPDNADGEDTPAFKRQATSRKLRPRGNEAPGRTQARVAPPGKVVAEGKGVRLNDL
ncbi:hypothetical protein C8F04DRAFT_1238184 [Mycena alexandri]|uniref:Uncharacterized protein n=1 Tax=Mycena alexandri TaxID=1745969 RepID=A0AAD6SHE2_9AGAR|nr:hypothetical protein C8F04DRAFT_1238184 [Mycena alexandri]